MSSYGTGQPSQQQDAPPAWAQELFGRLYNDMRAQAEQLRLLEQRIDERNRTSTTTAETIPRSTPLPSQATTTSFGNEARRLEIMKRKDRLPDLPEFNGKRSEFRSWLTQMQAKLSVDKSDETEDVQFWYVHMPHAYSALFVLESSEDICMPCWTGPRGRNSNCTLGQGFGGSLVLDLFVNENPSATGTSCRIEINKAHFMTWASLHRRALRNNSSRSDAQNLIWTQISIAKDCPGLGQPRNAKAGTGMDERRIPSVKSCSRRPAPDHSQDGQDVRRQGVPLARAAETAFALCRFGSLDSFVAARSYRLIRRPAWKAPIGSFVRRQAKTDEKRVMWPVRIARSRSRQVPIGQRRRVRCH
jgi:hypothetical protein